MPSSHGKLVFSMQPIKTDTSLVWLHTMSSRGTKLRMDQMPLNADSSVCSGLMEDATSGLDLKIAEKAK